MKNSIKLAIISMMALFLVPQLFAQEQKKPAPISKTKAQIIKFEDETLKIAIAHINKVKKDRISQINTSTEERIKAAKAKTALQKSMIRGAGPDANQRYRAQHQEIDNNLAQKEKVALDEFQEKQKQLQEEYQQKMKQRREDFYKQPQG